MCCEEPTRKLSHFIYTYKLWIMWLGSSSAQVETHGLSKIPLVQDFAQYLTLILMMPRNRLHKILHEQKHK